VAKTAKAASSEAAFVLSMKWSCKTGQHVKKYPALQTAYQNEKETQFFRQVENDGGVRSATFAETDHTRGKHHCRSVLLVRTAELGQFRAA
jgi:hypothetical protein